MLARRKWFAGGLIAALLSIGLVSCGGGGGEPGQTNQTSGTAASNADSSLPASVGADVQAVLQDAQAANEADSDNAASAARSTSDESSAMSARMGSRFKLSCLFRRNNSPDKLLECINVEGIRFHQRVLQKIADANNGTRVSGTKGFDDSARYAQIVFEAFGYQVTKQEFQFQSFIKLSPTVLERVSSTGNVSITTTIMSYSGSGDVTAPVSTPSVITGCNTTDFAGFTTGNIALISRGVCSFATKATNAAGAGAKAVVIYNNREGPLNGTLGEDFRLDLPVTAVTQVIGSELVAISPLQLRVKTETFRGTATTSNIIAESREGDPNNVVMVGAHLDSVDEGPGINDNGSGSAAILNLAIQMARTKPTNKVRFALWGAEESGLVGSERYVELLSEADRAKIALYLNFDMIGSPNPVYFIYDGDDSDATGAGPGPQGSALIEKTFEQYFTSKNLPFKGTDFDGRSDYGPFIAVGIPSGGLFTGAEGIKTEAEAALWGGTAGVAYDKCYHQACDTFDNVDLKGLLDNAKAMADATIRFAMDITGIRTPAAQARSQSQSAQRAGAPVPAWSHYPPEFRE
jgi:Zn-dependent M28 family amino/carboxypeptidase